MAFFAAISDSLAGVVSTKFYPTIGVFPSFAEPGIVPGSAGMDSLLFWKTPFSQL